MDNTLWRYKGNVILLNSITSISSIRDSLNFSVSAGGNWLTIMCKTREEAEAVWEDLNDQWCTYLNIGDEDIKEFKYGN